MGISRIAAASVALVVMLLVTLSSHADRPVVASAGSAGSVVTRPVADRVGPVSGPATPLLFIENVGQIDGRARFAIPTAGGTAWLADDGLWIRLTQQTAAIASKQDRRAGGLPLSDAPTESSAVRIGFTGAAPLSQPEPFGPVDTAISYFIGNNPAVWRTNVPVWSGIRYRDVYPGLDLELTSDRGRFAWRFVSRGEASASGTPDAGAVALQSTASSLVIVGNDLMIETVGGTTSIPLPAAPTGVGPIGSAAVTEPTIRGISLSGRSRRTVWSASRWPRQLRAR